MNQTTAEGGPTTLHDAELLIPTLQARPFAVQPVAKSPCFAACPAGIDVKSYVSLVAEERFQEALDVVRRRCPLPSVCGRVCHHPCEAACRRNEHDDRKALAARRSGRLGRGELDAVVPT